LAVLVIQAVDNRLETVLTEHIGNS
jgi:hypothetical protein